MSSFAGLPLRHPRLVAELPWASAALLADRDASGGLNLGGEIWLCLYDWERPEILEDLFWIGLDRADWALAGSCVAAGLVLVPEEGDGWVHDALTYLPGRPDVVGWLLDQGVDIERRGRWGASPLIAAATRREELATLRLLLSRGADVEATTQIDDNLSALLVAAEVGNVAVVSVLLELGADPSRLPGPTPPTDLSMKLD